ncbi:KUP/HAK/KT family potassium transporter, partial [Mesorhizobium sp.]
ALGVMLLVVGFGSSSSLASAYGISVTGEMLMTTILLFVVMRWQWKWQTALAAALALLFGTIDTGFFLANIVKFVEGGWVSIAVAGIMGLVMGTWIRGSRYLFDKTRRNEIPLDFLAGNLLKKKPQLVSGTAVFLTSDPVSAP